MTYLQLSLFSLKLSDSPVLLDAEHYLEQQLEVFLLSCMFLKHVNDVPNTMFLR